MYVGWGGNGQGTVAGKRDREPFGAYHWLGTDTLLTLELPANRGRFSIIKRAGMFSRIGIAVEYSRVDDEKERTLNITITGSKSCNLQSNKDPDERSLGFSLLSEWGILNTFRQIDNGDLRAMFPQLVRLFNREDDEITGGELRELGLDPDRLIEGGLLERRDRQDIVLIDEDDIDGEAAIKPSSTPGMVKATGPFGEDAGEYPLADMERFQLNREWLQETVLRLVEPLLTKKEYPDHRSRSDTFGGYGRKRGQHPGIFRAAAW